MAKAKFYTYVHRKADTNEVFYVGKGQGNRLGVRAGRSKLWKETVSLHGYVAEKVGFFDCEKDAFAHEKFLIQCQKEHGNILCNLTVGGEGYSGYIAPPEVRERRIAGIREMLADPVRREKRSLAMSQALTGKTFSNERKAKLSAAHKGIPLSESHKAGLRKRVCTEAHRANLKAANARPDVKARRSAAISAGMKGYVKSEEHRKALSEGLKASWARRKAEKLAQQA